MLVVRDLPTGAERVIATGLTRDDQEDFGALDLYPNYAFLPDGASIVMWNRGKLARVPLAGRRAGGDSVQGDRRAVARADGQLRRAARQQSRDGADSALGRRVARRQVDRVRRLRARVAPGRGRRQGRRRAAASDRGRRGAADPRVRAGVLTRRPIDCLRDVERH